MNPIEQNHSIIRTMEVNNLLRHADLVVERHFAALGNDVYSDVQTPFRTWDGFPAGGLDNYEYQMHLRYMHFADASLSAIQTLQFAAQRAASAAWMLANKQRFVAARALKGIKTLTFNR